MFKVHQIAGKGLGLIATQKIPRGQRILTDKILLSINSPNGDILQSAYTLSLQARQALLALSVNAAKYTSVLSWLESFWLSRWYPRSTKINHNILNIFRNNNFDIGDSIRAVFPAAARINHACVPNAQGNFNSVLDAFTVHATHDLFEGDEITISYLDDQLGLRQWRQSTLLGRYGFACDCAACGAHASVREAREARRVGVRQELAVLSGKAAAHGQIAPEEELILMTKMLEVYEAEGLRGREVSSL